MVSTLKPKYEETIEIIPKIDGTLLCSLSWREHTFQEELPRGCDRWPEKEFKAHMQSFVIPRLRLQLLKVQRAALEEAEVPPEACVAMAELDLGDVDSLQKAGKKRERKAAKLKALN